MLPNPRWFIPAVILYTLIFYAVMVSVCHAEPTDSQIVEAIGKAENSVKYPYGVKSINTHGNKAYARQICLNSVRNARKRCVGQDLIVCMGKRYSPPDINPNWVRLVKYFLEKGRKK